MAVVYMLRHACREWHDRLASIRAMFHHVTAPHPQDCALARPTLPYGITCERMGDCLGSCHGSNAMLHPQPQTPVHIQTGCEHNMLAQTDSKPVGVCLRPHEGRHVSKDTARRPSASHSELPCWLILQNRSCAACQPHMEAAVTCTAPWHWTSPLGCHRTPPPPPAGGKPSCLCVLVHAFGAAAVQPPLTASPEQQQSSCMRAQVASQHDIRSTTHAGTCAQEDVWV
jgi:hypothetical protein